MAFKQHRGRWRQFLPILYINISIPLLSVRTSVMYDRAETLEREYVMFHITLWKWSATFALYDTYRRVRMREAA